MYDNAHNEDTDARTMLTAEIDALRQQSNALIARVRGGDNSPRLRARIERNQAVQVALMGFPEALAA